MLAGNGDAADVLANPAAESAVASAPFTVAFVTAVLAFDNVDLTFINNSCNSIACLAINAALPSAVSAPNNCAKVSKDCFFMSSPACTIAASSSAAFFLAAISSSKND